MKDFLEANASIFNWLAGGVGGALITLVVGWLLRKRDYDLRLWDKFIERRIQAHENLINVALEMRTMVMPGAVDEKGEIIRGPRVLLSQEIFEQWFSCSMRTVLAGSTWLTTDAKREANFLQDYLATLQLHLQPIPSDDYLSLGYIIREDFLAISGSLERAAFSFFEKDARQLRLSNLDERHKYPREQTEQRLKDTQLWHHWSKSSPVADAEADTDCS